MHAAFSMKTGQGHSMMDLSERVATGRPWLSSFAFGGEPKATKRIQRSRKFITQVAGITI